ncbi:hypothetical protein GEMRC1_012214 [Eukaryota sp. GEM-RC1]
MPNVFIYIDDVIIAHNDFKVFTDTLKEIFKRARKHRIRFGIRKCSFVTKKSKITVLGAIFQDGKRSIDPDRIEAIANLPIPTTIFELRSFCGSINYLRDWIPNLSQLTQPLTNLTRKDPETRLTISKKWTDAHTKNFIEIKRLISNSVDLALPDDESTIIISTDASDKAISGIIWKKLDNSDPHEPLEDRKLAPISFFSKTLSDTQSNWPIIQKELFAIVCTLNQPKLSSFLISKRLIIFCDHRNIVYLINHPDKNRIVTRWIPLLLDLTARTCAIKKKWEEAEKHKKLQSARTYVLRFNENPGRLHGRWLGPYRVIQSSPNSSKLQLLNLATNVATYSSVHLCKPFISSSDNPEYYKAIAALDKEEFTIRRIISVDRRKNTAYVEWTCNTKEHVDLGIVKNDSAYSRFMQLPENKKPRFKSN